VFIIDINLFLGFVSRIWS